MSPSCAHRCYDLCKVLRSRISRATSQVLKKSLREKTETYQPDFKSHLHTQASPTFSESQGVSQSAPLALTTDNLHPQLAGDEELSSN